MDATEEDDVKPDGEHGRHYLPAGAKPYLQTLMHCCGLSLCGVLMLLRRVVGDRRPWVEHRSKRVVTMQTFILAGIEVTGTWLQYVALLFMPVSMWLMLRGSVLVFAPAIRHLVLGKSMSCEKFRSLLIIALGLIFVGIAVELQLYETEGEHSSYVERVGRRDGIAMLVAAQLLQAIKTVWEEDLLQRVEVDPIFLVVLEGLCGITWLAVGAWPVLQVEDAKMRLSESFQQDYDLLTGNDRFLKLAIAYVFSIVVLNVAAVILVKLTTATTCLVVDVARTVLVWLSAVLLYQVGETDAGEQVGWWTVPEVLGFVLILAGAWSYSRPAPLQRDVLLGAVELG
jgi:hypothetical protein